MKIVEVGPRDGLQNEAAVVSVETKVKLIESLTDAGVRHVECGSFVSPTWVPQMANTAEVFAQIQRVPGVSYSALVPNLRGFADAVRCQVSEVAVFASASESFSRRNINCSIDESLSRLSAVVKEAHIHAMRVRGYVSCVLGCPYEGRCTARICVPCGEGLSEDGLL